MVYIPAYMIFILRDIYVYELPLYLGNPFNFSFRKNSSYNKYL